MKKLHCKPGDIATVTKGTVLPIPGSIKQHWAIGKIVQVLYLIGPADNFNADPAFPCWKLATPMLSPNGLLYSAVYDAVLAPLPPPDDVFEHDWEVFVKEHKVEIEEVIHGW